MRLIEFFKEENIYIDFKCENRDEFFQKINEQLLNKKMIKETFLKAILEREKEFPTGLNFGEFNVAIPHCDSKHVVDENIIVVIPEKKFYFRDMGLNENELPIDIIFLLLIKKGEKQASILERLMDSFSDELFVNEIIGSQTKKEILNKIVEKLN